MIPSTTNPVILIPGYCEPMQLFAYLGGEIKRAGWRIFGMDDHFPALWDIRSSAELLAGKVQSVLRETGAQRVDLVSHSLGGLMGRYFIKFMGGEAHVERCITLATPHHGTYTAFFALDQAARQMRPGSDFLSELNDGHEAHGEVQYTSIWTRMDQMIVPKESARLEGANNHPIRLGFHNQMMFTGTCAGHVLAALEAPTLSLEVGLK